MIDTHCHLQMKTFADDIEEVIDRAVAVGVRSIINVGFDIESSEKAVELCWKYPMMFAAVGIHPHDARTYASDTLSVLDGFLKEDKVVAVGEIGLDFKRNLSAPDVQKRVFAEQLLFAQAKDVPVILHIRDAYSEVFDTLEEKKPEKVLLHCFSGNSNYAKRAIKKGYYISFAGNITYSKNRLPLALRVVPLNRLFLETDAPFLSPVPRRGQRNEPCFLEFTALEVARIKDVNPEEIKEITAKNALEFFRMEYK